MEKADKAAKLAKLVKGVTSVAGVVGIAVFTIYWFDLDDKLVAAVTTKMKKKAETLAAQAQEG